MTFDWQTEYARALTTFGGDTPSATLEQDLLDAFQQHPQAVTNAITKIGKAYEAGKIHSPWGALKAEIPKQVARDVKVGDGTERNRAIANAEQWMRTTGLMFDRSSEVEDELFGDRGTLQPWKRDHALVQKMTNLWQQLRPAGEATEALELQRANAWKANRNNPQPPAATDTELRAKAHALGAAT
jgi:hypothetical protein